MAISKNPKIIMDEKQFVERLMILASRKTYYKNVYPDNLCYVHADGRTSADCVNLVKSVLNGYNVYNNTPGYCQRDLSNTGDCTESELLAQCDDVSSDFTKLGDKPMILYMKGHIGVYLGKDIDRKFNVIECTKSFGGGIVYSWVDKDGIRRNVNGGNANGRWTHYGKPSKWVCSASECSNSHEKEKIDYSNYPILKYGNKGEYVKILQRLLLGKGYDCKGIDGIWGKNTNAMVLKFQKENSDIYGKQLVADGYVGPLTWGALYK